MFAVPWMQLICTKYKKSASTCIDWCWYLICCPLWRTVLTCFFLFFLFWVNTRPINHRAPAAKNLCGASEWSVTANLLISCRGFVHVQLVTYRLCSYLMWIQFLAGWTSAVGRDPPALIAASKYGRCSDQSRCTFEPRIVPFYWNVPFPIINHLI